MARTARDNLHSRLVAILKVTLPLVALAILSTLFLFSRTIDPEDAIPYADVDIADRLREPRMTGAGYSGVTVDGSALTLTAAEAAPDASGGTARELHGRLETPDGARTDIAAFTARLDSAAKLMHLTGGVEITSSTGWLLGADGFDIALDRTSLQSTGPVAGSGPGGQISANSLRIERQGAAGSPYLLVFNGGVRLLYQPEK